MKKKLVAIVIIIVSLLYAANVVTQITGSITAPLITSTISDTGDLHIYFCPHQDCETNLVQFIESAEHTIHCALFDIGLESVQLALDNQKEKGLEVHVVTDDHYLKKYTRDFVKPDRSGLMHNKFCIIDDKKVSTGSMNPTNNGAHKNNNNLIFINSEQIAQNYEDEFSELYNNTFKKGKKVTNPIISLNNTIIETYFCPEDKCAQKVTEELQHAKTSIHFMVFSFTHEEIGNQLLLKHLDNLTMKGVMEARQVSKYSQFMRLNQSGIDVHKDKNKNNLHHKVFIIDENTVITGSFNPSNNGDKRNDENLIILRDKEIAKLYLEEFEYVYGQATSPLQ